MLRGETVASAVQLDLRGNEAGVRKAKARWLLRLGPGASAIFGSEAAKVAGGDRGMQGVASLDTDPVPGQRPWGKAWRDWRRRDALPMLAVFGAQDASHSAYNPSHCFRRRGAGKEIGGNAARLSLPALALICGMVYTAGRAEPPQGTAIRRSKDDLWGRDLRQSFHLRSHGRASGLVQSLPFCTVDFAGGRRRRRCRRCSRGAGAECIGDCLLLGCLRGLKPIVLCIVLASVSGAVGFGNLRHP